MYIEYIVVVLQTQTTDRISTTLTFVPSFLLPFELNLTSDRSCPCCCYPSLRKGYACPCICCCRNHTFRRQPDHCTMRGRPPRLRNPRNQPGTYLPRRKARWSPACNRRRYHCPFRKAWIQTCRTQNGLAHQGNGCFPLC